MIAKIISTQDGKVIIDEVILSVPELKALREKTDDVRPFEYLWALYSPESPYMNYDETERPDMVHQDYFNENCTSEEFFAAKRKCQEMYNSPIRRILMGAKSAIEKFANYFSTMELSEGRDGNLTSVKSALCDLPKLIRGFQDAEQAYKQEISKNKAGVISAIDEDYKPDYSD